MHYPEFELRSIHFPRTPVNNVSTLWEKRAHGLI
jgi:hypothetical protein